MEFTLRAALPGDAEILGQIHYTAWMQTYTGLLPTEYLARLSAEKSAAMFARTDCRDMVLAECNGQAAGFCSWFPSRTEPDAGEIAGLYLLAEFHRRGIGKAMLQHGLSMLKHMGFRTASLWVLDSNANAIAFYEAMGLRPTGRIKQAELCGQIITELQYSKPL